MRTATRPFGAQHRIDQLERKVKELELEKETMQEAISRVSQLEEQLADMEGVLEGKDRVMSALEEELDELDNERSALYTVSVAERGAAVLVGPS